MDVRKLVLLVGALLIAGITAVVARNMFAGNAVPVAAGGSANIGAPAEADGPAVLVAKKPLTLGTIIAADMLAYQPWPKDMVDGAYFLKGQTDISTLVGKVVRFDIAAGQPVPQGAMVGPGERGFLAAALGPGMRALTISVSDTTGGGGFIFPGDRVDIVLTQEVTGEGQPLKVSETILRNVRVLAIDQTVAANPAEPKVGRTVTLELTPKFSEKVAVAQSIGTLSLSLRSLADSATELDRAIASGEVEVAANQDSKADRALEMALARQPTDVGASVTTGAEVSRFQRSTPPPQPKRSSDGGEARSADRGDKPAGPVIQVARGTAVTAVAIGTN